MGCLRARLTCPSVEPGLRREMTTTRTSWLTGPEGKGRTEELRDWLVVLSNGVRKPRGGDGVRKWESRN